MSNEERERSWEDGEPIGYFDFFRGSVHWRYNTSDSARELNGEMYAPLSIRRETIQQGTERNKLLLTVVLPRDADVAGNWHPYPTSAMVNLTIYEAHLDETGADVVWDGRVSGPKFTATLLTLACEPTTTFSRRSGQLQSWQRPCMHVLYKQGHGLCNADPDEFKQDCTIESVTGSAIVSPDFESFPTGRLAGGYIEWATDDGNIERRSVSSHVGDTIVALFPPRGMTAGTVVTAYPGCKHNWQDCDEYFDNGVNYGGDLYAPERSPWNGNPVY